MIQKSVLLKSVIETPVDDTVNGENERHISSDGEQ